MLNYKVVDHYITSLFRLPGIDDATDVQQVLIEPIPFGQFLLPVFSVPSNRPQAVLTALQLASLARNLPESSLKQVVLGAGHQALATLLGKVE